MIRFRAVAAPMALLLVASVWACGSKSSPKKGETKADAGPTAPPPLAKVLHIGLEYVVIDPDAEPPRSRVALIFTDETGASRRELIGEFDGGCSDVSGSARADAMKPILGLDCWAGETGVQIRFAHRKSKLYVVSANVKSGETPEYQPLKTIDLPFDTPIKTDWD